MEKVEKLQRFIKNVRRDNITLFLKMKKASNKLDDATKETLKEKLHDYEEALNIIEELIATGVIK